MRTALWISGLILASLATVGCGGSQATVIQAGKMPPGGTFDGVYQSPAYGRMEFTVDGKSALGLYEGERHWGRIEGEVNGNLLTFHWTQWNADMQGKVRESSGRGYFKYKIDVEGGATTTREVHRLKGEWGYGEAETGNVWGAVKLSKRAKKRLKPYSPDAASSEMSSEDEYGASGFDESAGGEMNQETEVQMSEPEAEEEEDSGGGVDDLFD